MQFYNHLMKGPNENYSKSFELVKNENLNTGGGKLVETLKTFFFESGNPMLIQLFECPYVIHEDIDALAYTGMEPLFKSVTVHAYARMDASKVFETFIRCVEDCFFSNGYSLQAFGDELRKKMFECLPYPKRKGTKSKGTYAIVNNVLYCKTMMISGYPKTMNTFFFKCLADTECDYLLNLFISRSDAGNGFSVGLLYTLISSSLDEIRANIQRIEEYGDMFQYEITPLDKLQVKYLENAFPYAVPNFEGGVQLSENELEKLLVYFIRDFGKDCDL